MMRLYDDCSVALPIQEQAGRKAEYDYCVTKAVQRSFRNMIAPAADIGYQLQKSTHSSAG